MNYKCGIYAHLYGSLYTQDKIISQDKLIAPDFVNYSSQLKQEIGNKRI